ncbi:MFS transporter [Paraburkholderia sp. J41]|uniref:MFS transporter n=1 Tax=Paraburkholderia sp. J41 TaxID=2805433 RepID=UPI002AC348F1|nr:MFS transporter [Paraburkholderia sp. J41]
MDLINRASVDSEEQHRLYSKIASRLLPLLLLMYVVSFLDRINVGFAKLQMAGSIGLSDAQYGLGAGIFFLGYCVFEIPSNLMLHRVGARLWIARIMIVWGLVTMLTLLVQGPRSFYAARVLLGVAEAGFYPGIILYLTTWFPTKVRSQIMAIFICGIVIAGMLGGPISGGIMAGLDGAWGFAGWQWLFALEGLPAILLGIVCLRSLPNGPASARWLTDEERTLHEEDQRRDRAATRSLPGQAYRIGLVFRNRNIWLLVIANFSNLATSYAVSFWMPQIVRNFGLTKNLAVIGLITSAPFLLAGIAMLFAGRYADRTGDRRRPLCVGLFVACVGLTMTGLYMSVPGAAFSGLVLACVGTMVATPTLWALPGMFLSGSAAAAGIALMTTVGNLSGYVAPFLIGVIKEATGSMAYGFILLAGFALAGMIAVLYAPVTRTPGSPSPATDAPVVR